MATASSNHQTKVEEQNLVVALRTRPLNEEELLQGATTICHCVDNKMCVLLDPQEDPDDILRANRTREKQFIFDHSLDGSMSQEEVYQKTSRFVIPTVVKGYNATVFAYGATGAGKTYTMLGTDDEPGIMYRALNDLFKEMETTSEDYTYKVSMSYLEIYNEMIRDLLNPETGFLDLREDTKGVQVPGLSEISAHSSTDVMEMLVKGNKERTQEPTAANKTSSRSHAILQVTVKQRPRVHGHTHEVRTGKLFLIDLAGSERAAATHNRGKRMVEGAHINRSLLALGNCINALSEKNGAKYVNFRDSKLTRLLKDALGGNCKTVMIAHVSPASIHFEETRNTLLYGERAKHIKTKVRRNVMDVQYHIHQYTNIISELREEVKRLRTKLDKQALNNKNAASIQAIQREVMETHPTSHRFQEQPVYHQGYVYVPGEGYYEVQGHLSEHNAVQTAHAYFTPSQTDVPLHVTSHLTRPVSQATVESQTGSARSLSTTGVYVTSATPASRQVAGRAAVQPWTSRNVSSAHSMRSIKSTTTALTEIMEENAAIFGETEVLEVAQREDNTDLTRLKEQLIHVFRDQMELRRSLMELDNTAMEIRLETARNQLLIQKWDKERALAQRRKEKDTDGKESREPREDKENQDNLKDTQEENQEKGQKEEGEKEEEKEPEEVRGAREEMLTLMEEKERTDRLKSSVSKELENAREKASKIEQLLPKKVNSKDQQEILSLLVKSHELEIENMEMQSACLLRNFEIRRKDMVIAKYRQHLNLCDEIIHQQRSLIDEYEVPVPKDLDELFELYAQEEGERPESTNTVLPDLDQTNPNKAVSMTSLNRRLLESDSMSDIDKLNVVDEEVTQLPASTRVLAPSTKKQFFRNIKPPAENDEDAIFSRSAQAQQIREAQARALASRTSLTSHTDAAAAPPQRQRSIITLSSHSASPPPPAADPAPVSRPPGFPEGIRRQEIASKTRNIAALAAARRSKAQLDAQNSERLSSFVSSQTGREKRVEDGGLSGPILTASRLAQHDSRYNGSTVTLQHLIDDDFTVDEPLPTLRNLPQPAVAAATTAMTRSRYRNINSRTNPPGARKKVTVQKRARSQDIANYPSLSPQSFFRQLSKTTPARRTTDTGLSTGVGRRPRITPPATKTSRSRAAKNQKDNAEESIREFEMLTPTTSVLQSNTEKGRGLTVQKRVRGPNHVIDSPSMTPRKPRAKRPPPTIPAGYRKTDMAIAGFALKK